MQQQIHQQETHFVFLLLKTAQNNYGVKNSDYLRYRRYCTRKVEKLRQLFNYKYGNRTKFIKKDILKDKANQPKILQLALFQAQRNWAAANEAKFSTSQKPSQKSRLRFFSMRKLKRAYQWSKKLTEICKQKTQASTKLEAQSYEAYLQGLWLFESQKWSQAQTKLIACRQILADLMKNCDTLTERIYKQKIDQIQQTIKYCSFKLSKGKQMTINQIIQMKKTGDPTLATLMETLTEKKLESITLQKNNNEIKFNNQRYPIKSEQIMLQKGKIDSEIEVLGQIKQNYNKNVEDQKTYEELLNFYSGIVLLIDQAVKMTDKQKQDLNKYTQGEVQILKKISLLFQQMKLNMFIDRNQLIFLHSFHLYDNNTIDRKSTPQTLSKLLTNTISLFTQMSQLQKQKSQVSHSFEPQKIQYIDAKIFYFRSIRLALVGQVYFNNDKIKQAYSLWRQCERCLGILQQNQRLTKQDIIVNLNKIQSIVNVGKLRCIIKNRQIQLNDKKQLNQKIQNIQIDENQKLESDITLENVINGTVSDVKMEELVNLSIIELPGKLLPIPPRPIFLNIFQSQLSYPSLDKKLQQKGKSSWWNKFFK